MLVNNGTAPPPNYQQLLSAYLDAGSENGLAYAYELGRTNLKNGVGLLELAEQHQSALEEALRSPEHMHEGTGEITRAANCFLKEALSPFEIARLSSSRTQNALVRLYDVFENEAKRIAHRLHDECAQMLAVVYLELAEIAQQSPPEKAEQINSVVAHLDEVCGQLRSLSHELRPIILDNMGLMPALKALVDGVKKRSSLVIDVRGDTGGRLNPAIETVVYRATQEALNNIGRHAHARRAEIHVWRDNDYLYCVISDDGIGFKVNKDCNKQVTGLGLIGIKERARALGGKFEISSQPGIGSECGTKLKVTIPL